jgi:uncharacterized RDD family membrane protein YckC
MNMEWKCPNCGTLLKKPDSWQDIQKDTVRGTIKCNACSEAYNAKEIAEGKYDITQKSSGIKSGNHKFANFGQRLLAYLIDQVILIIIIVVLGRLLTLSSSPVDVEAFQGLAIVISWLYFAFQESSKKQATIGKRILAIKVTGISGQKISFGNATGRFFGKILSGAIFGIGFLMAIWTEKKQTLHDQLANTLVLTGK